MVLSLFSQLSPSPSTHIRLDHLPRSASHYLQNEVKILIPTFSFIFKIQYYRNYCTKHLNLLVGSF